ncbi:hypothetical protein MKW92_009347 [Papaver armeniacum]|nr:hypothetical protein MKW92_009347 [Papaver armeniacum]
MQEFYRTAEALIGLTEERIDHYNRRREELNRSSEEPNGRREELCELIDGLIDNYNREREEHYRRMEEVSGLIRDEQENINGLRRVLVEHGLYFHSVSNRELLEGEDIKSHMKNIIFLDDGEVCPVCFQDMNVGAVVLKCSHVFHENCVLEWAKRKPNCPVCRHDMRKDRQQKLKPKRLTYPESRTPPRRRLPKEIPDLDSNICPWYLSFLVLSF